LKPTPERIASKRIIEMKIISRFLIISPTYMKYYIIKLKNFKLKSLGEQSMKKIYVLIFTIFISLSLFGCNPNEEYCTPGSTKGVYVCEVKLTSYFDTLISLKVYVDKTSDQDIEEIFTDFEALAVKYHELFDKYHEYEDINNVYTINNSEDPVIVSEELFRAIEYALERDDLVIKDDVKMFNIALNPVLEIWHDARNSDSCEGFINDNLQYEDFCPIPQESDFNQEFNIDPEDVILTEETLSIGFAKENMSIDLGGFAKGYFSELAIDYLEEFNLNYVLNLGSSNVYANGVNLDRESGEYYIALTKPFPDLEDEVSYYAVIKLTDGLNLVSSGNYQRYFKNINDYDDETLYHHIIDPRTYYPGGESASITLLSDDGALGDILSTTLYLLPVEEALEYVNAHENLEAIWYIDSETVVMSDGFSEYLMEPIN